MLGNAIERFLFIFIRDWKKKENWQLICKYTNISIEIYKNPFEFVKLIYL